MEEKKQQNVIKFYYVEVIVALHALRVFFHSEFFNFVRFFCFIRPLKH